MDLIVSERVKTWGAFMIGNEWSDFGTRETSLDNLSEFLRRTLEKESRRATVRLEGNTIVIDFINAIDIVVSQLRIDHNSIDRDQIISELRVICQKLK